MDEIIKDSRFAHIVKDARFKKLPKKHVKVKIDKRFQSMFNEKKFHEKYKVDKRGRRVKLGGSEDLRRFYELSDCESEGEEEESVEGQQKSLKGKEVIKKNEEVKKKKKEEKGNESNEAEENDVMKKEENKIIAISEKYRKTLTPEVKKKLKDLTIDYARGEGAIFSDSSSDEESSDTEGSIVLEFDHEWGELDKDAESTNEATSRLAVCNMNWDRIEAVDLMVLFNSFLPAGGIIHSVTIYPSEFGLQRMKEEEEKGPLELTESVPELEDEEINRIQMEKLRKYQLNRLKYYYAVVVCDSVETADALYKECDGLEYESSSSRLDLRFIPDDTTFDQDPKESCDTLPDLTKYKPRLFMTSALTKAKVDLTWDETDPNREEVVKSIHAGNVDESHLKKYLACSSSDEEAEEEENKEKEAEVNGTSNLSELDKYKALLAEIEFKEKKAKKNEVNLEVTWNLELENKASEIVKEVAKEKDKKTPFQKYLEKRREKKKKKREERKAQLEETNQGSGDSVFSDDDIPSDIDLNDPYFKEEFENFKRKKSKKKSKEKEEENVEEKQKKAELELLMLDNEPEGKHFSLKKIEECEKAKKKKGRKKKAKEEEKDFKDDFKIDVNDERFSALYTSHLFNIDPADPQFRATKATKELIEEKLRRREAESDETPQRDKSALKREAPKEPNQKKDAELSVLVKKIKKNTEEVHHSKVRH